MSYQINLRIHGHSCLELRTTTDIILFDPWLKGSAYWRSWWNFPEQKNIEELISEISNVENIYVYITHLHWDHFHGPSLRILYREIPKIKFLIPKVPETRLKNDLLKILGNKINIIEINHGQLYIVSPNIKIQPFLAGPILTDSAVLINCDNNYILNLNDSKQQKLMINQIKSNFREGKLKVMLRSHASANSRVCQRNRDGGVKLKADKKIEEYSKEFLLTARIFKPEVAIPFASNMCYLHKDTYKYNFYSNTSDKLLKFYRENIEYSDINLKLILPGEKLNVNDLKISENKTSRNQLFSDRYQVLKSYREKYKKKIERSEFIQGKGSFSEIIFKKYFYNVFKYTPFIISKLVHGKVAFIEKKDHIYNKFFIVDMRRKKIFLNAISYDDCETLIIVRPGVLNSCLMQNNLNSLGISKLLEVRSSSIRQYNLFFAICVASEIGSYPFISIKQSIRSFKIWIRRFREIIDYILIILRFNKLI